MKYTIKISCNIILLQDDYHHLNHKKKNDTVQIADNKHPITYANTTLQTSQYSNLAIQDGKVYYNMSNGLCVSMLFADDYQNHKMTNGNDIINCCSIQFYVHRKA